jgi:hypothetical protein
MLFSGLKQLTNAVGCHFGSPFEGGERLVHGGQAAG